MTEITIITVLKTIRKFVDGLAIKTSPRRIGGRSRIKARGVGRVRIRKSSRQAKKLLVNYRPHRRYDLCLLSSYFCCAQISSVFYFARRKHSSLLLGFRLEAQRLRSCTFQGKRGKQVRSKYVVLLALISSERDLFVLSRMRRNDNEFKRATNMESKKVEKIVKRLEVELSCEP